MNTGLSDFVEKIRARGASILPGAETGTPGSATDRTAADEAALTNILRLLNLADGLASLTPVERAFVLGAKAIFEELTNVCEKLLTAQAAAPTVEPLVVPPAAPTPQEPATRRPRSSQRPTPGGGTPPQ